MANDHSLPVLPIRNSVLFPEVAMQIAVDRPASLAAVEAALTTEDQAIAVFAQHGDRLRFEPGRRDPGGDPGAGGAPGGGGLIPGRGTGSSSLAALISAVTSPP